MGPRKTEEMRGSGRNQPASIESEVSANGPRLVHRLDGNVLCDVKDNDPAALRTGAIALNMSSGTIVEFKDLRLIRMRQTR